MTNLYDRLAATDDGAGSLARARLRFEVLSALHRTLKATGLTQSELARRLGVRKSAVNQVLNGDGNLRVSTISDYLHALGYELSISPVPLGRSRQARTHRASYVIATTPPIFGEEFMSLSAKRYSGPSEFPVTGSSRHLPDFSSAEVFDRAGFENA